MRLTYPVDLKVMSGELFTPQVTSVTVKHRICSSKVKNERESYFAQDHKSSFQYKGKKKEKKNQKL